MDPASKKRKSDENGTAAAVKLSSDDAGKILDSFTQEQLLDIVKTAICRGDPAILDEVRAIADHDPTQRKLFIRGLGWDTNSDSLRAVYTPFGELEEAVVINDKATGRSKGYGFITFRHIDGALLALKEPSKKIDGRVTVTQLASAGNTVSAAAPAPIAADVAVRKIFVGNVPADMSSDRLLAHFSSYGEIEEGPVGMDKLTGKFRGYALFVYKTVEAARAALVDTTKTIDGHSLMCKLANADSKRGKPGAPGTAASAPVGVPQGQPNAEVTPGNGLTGTQSQFGMPGSGQSSFIGYTGTGLPGAGGLSHHHHHHSLNSPLQSFGLGAPGLSSAGSQGPSSLGGSGAGSYGGSLGGSYGSSLQYGAPGSGGYGGLGGGLGMGSSLYGMPPGSAGLPSRGYPESGQFPLSSSVYQSQHQQQGGSPGRRYQTGAGLYQSHPPYF